MRSLLTPEIALKIVTYPQFHRTLTLLPWDVMTVEGRPHCLNDLPIG